MAQPVRLAEDLEHHRVYVATLGDTVTMAAVGTADVILILEVHANPSRGRLLARVQVHEAGNTPFRELAVDAFLKGTDRPHDCVGP